eukprot:TRINITY_DN7615_c0_g2_i2.p1 TRINITY_DN7615_c0_g2~~TRINITY_DN7615_c0_g2_i2.p1  ORF type:complete len:176 (-),score=3.37 TRINITY_DN7615_c0_g2_i2:671-1198(-)
MPKRPSRCHCAVTQADITSYTFVCSLSIHSLVALFGILSFHILSGTYEGGQSQSYIATMRGVLLTLLVLLHNIRNVQRQRHREGSHSPFLSSFIISGMCKGKDTERALCRTPIACACTLNAHGMGRVAIRFLRGVPSLLCGAPLANSPLLERMALVSSSTFLRGKRVYEDTFCVA